MTNGRVHIREARASDAEGVAAILNAIIATGAYTALDTPVSAAEERRFIEAFPARGIFLVAVAPGDEVVGFQNVEPFATFTHAFDHVGVIGTFISLERRRLGIGRQLFAAMFDAAVGKGYRKLVAYVRADNPAAQAAYAAHGFGVVGIARAQAYIRGRYVDEIFIERTLVPRENLELGSWQ